VPISTTLAQLSDNLMYSAIAVYAITMLVYAAEASLRSRAAASPSAKGSVIPVLGGSQRASPVPELDRPEVPGHRVGRIAVSLTVLAFGLHAAAVSARGLAAGRAPWGNMYEFAAAAALAATGAYLLFLRREPVRDLGVWIIAIVTLALGLAVTVLYTPAGALVPALNSYWLVIHVAAAIVSGGVFTVGAGALILYLIRAGADRRAGDRAERHGYAAHLPPARTLERIAHTAHVFAFPIWTFAVIAGAIWAEDSWGRYWGWDPKETWAFITWVLYAAHLHAQSTAGWRGRKATWFAIAGYLAFVFNFFGVNMWITGLHSYAGV
jgi:cytochrome c-type biogenesis protein CcsB